MKFQMLKTRLQLLRFMFIFLTDWCMGTAAPVPLHVGVILDLDTQIGNMSSRCISTALEEFYAVNEGFRTRVVLHTRDARDVVSAVIAAVELLKVEEVKAFVGPQKSAQAEIIAELGNRARVPVLSFSVASPSISRSQMQYFVRMDHNETYQFEAIASIILAFGWKDVLLIYEESDYGYGVIPYFIDALETSKVRIPYKIVIPTSATEHQILEELVKLSRKQTRVFVVHLSSRLGLLLFKKAQEIGLMNEGNAWILTDEITSSLGYVDYNLTDSMQGVLGIKHYIPRSGKLDGFKVRMFKKNSKEGAPWDGSNIFCLHAFDTIWMLAMAAERVYTNDSFRKPTEPNNMSEDQEIGISEIGPELLNAILNSNFEGLSGEIRLPDGQLQPPVFQIINLDSQGEREIGFWIPTVGLSAQPDGPSQLNLRPIIWPGNSLAVPKGWAISANVTKVKVAYPVKYSFQEFVNISSDGMSATGYCIDIFKAVMESLPYAVPYEFVPFQKANGERGGSYDDLVHQVFLQKYDAVVGDITITANRSLFVDFSLPYTTGGVAMLIPIKYEYGNSLSFIFQILTGSAWLSYFTVFTITTIVCCAVEHLILSSFSVAKIPASFWIIFSEAFVDQSKKVPKYLVLMFVAANITLCGFLMHILVHVLFAEYRQLIDVDAKDLIRSGASVGYQKDSYVEMVLKQLNFDESQLQVYNSPEEYDDALERGSENGGVAAIFDEIPYIKLLMRKYCGKYRRVGPIYRMEGFGIVFPRGSSLVPDVSRAILSLVEAGKMAEIERTWLGSENTCPGPTKRSSKFLLLYKLWGTFVTVLLFTSCCLLLAVAIISSRNKHKSSVTSINIPSDEQDQLGMSELPQLIFDPPLDTAEEPSIQR